MRIGLPYSQGVNTQAEEGDLGGLAGTWLAYTYANYAVLGVGGGEASKSQGHVLILDRAIRRDRL